MESGSQNPLPEPEHTDRRERRRDAEAAGREIANRYRSSRVWLWLGVIVITVAIAFGWLTWNWQGASFGLLQSYHPSRLCAVLCLIGVLMVRKGVNA